MNEFSSLFVLFFVFVVDDVYFPTKKKFLFFLPFKDFLIQKMDTLLALDENIKQIPNLKLSEDIYSYDNILLITKNNERKRNELKDNILFSLENDSMTSLYLNLCQKYQWEINEIKLQTMRLLFFHFSLISFFVILLFFIFYLFNF